MQLEITKLEGIKVMVSDLLEAGTVICSPDVFEMLKAALKGKPERGKVEKGWP